MKKIFTILLLNGVIVFGQSFLFAQSNSKINAVDAAEKTSIISVHNNSVGHSVAKNSSKGLLFDNAQFVTHGSVPSDVDTSMLQLTNTTLGAGHKNGIGYSIADDFAVPSQGWIVDSLVFFGYQTNSTTTSTFTGYFVRIWNGAPNAGGTVVWGDTTTNVLTSSVFSNTYRSSATFGTTRPIMRSKCVTSGLSLTTSTYWVEWSATGSLTSGPWCVPGTILNQTISGDALQRTPGEVWNNLTDGGSLDPLSGTFILYGTIGVGIQEDNNPNNISIFPVPVKNIVNVNLGSVTNANVSITNILGEVIDSKTNINGTTSFDLSNVAKGTYIVKIAYDNVVLSKKITVIE